MPRALDGSEHYTDMAIIPMQMITAPYVESAITPEARAKFFKLYAPHSYSPQAYYPPYDKRPRNYTYWVQDGLSAGGMSFDENVLGGPSTAPTSFSPGVILWDTGDNGAGVGVISVSVRPCSVPRHQISRRCSYEMLQYYPTTSTADIVATSQNLTIRYVPSQDFTNTSISSNVVQLNILSQPDFQLGKSAFANNLASLPGLDLTLSGNIVSQGNRSISYGATINNVYYYNLTYTFPASLRNGGGVPEMVVSWKKTTPPKYDLYLQ